jgi:hypothetical protein
MRVFKTKVFARFARKERINDRELIEAIERAEQGLIDAALGGGLIKQRIARPGSGRSGGYRAVIALRTKERAIFIHGFAKNDQANIGTKELEILQDIARAFLSASFEVLENAVSDGKLYEIKTRMR